MPELLSPTREKWQALPLRIRQQYLNTTAVQPMRILDAVRVEYAVVVIAVCARRFAAPISGASMHLHVLAKFFD